MFGRGAKFPTYNTFSECVDMDFVDFVDTPSFYTSKTHFRYSPHRYLRGEEKGGQTAGMFRVVAIPNWLSVFGAPGIIVVGRDLRFVGEISRISQRSRHCFAIRNTRESSKFGASGA